MSKGKLCISHIVLIFASFLSVFPLYYMVCGATNQSIDVVRGKLFPGTYLVENFKALIANQNLGLAMINSFRNAILMTIITLLVCSIAGYGFEIYHDKGKDIARRAAVLCGGAISKRQTRRLVRSAAHKSGMRLVLPISRHRFLEQAGGRRRRPGNGVGACSDGF